jgi:hypothetical protein
MAHLSQEELSRRLIEAAALVEVGARYTHYKSSDKEYLVKSLAILEEDESVAVVYEGQYGAFASYVRPLLSWVETVEWEGKRVQRFTKI